MSLRDRVGILQFFLFFAAWLSTCQAQETFSFDTIKKGLEPYVETGIEHAPAPLKMALKPAMVFHNGEEEMESAKYAQHGDLVFARMGAEALVGGPVYESTSGLITAVCATGNAKACASAATLLPQAAKKIVDTAKDGAEYPLRKLDERAAQAQKDLADAQARGEYTPLDDWQPIKDANQTALDFSQKLLNVMKPFFDDGRGGTIDMGNLSASSPNEIRDRGPDEKRTIDKQPVQNTAQARARATLSNPDYMSQDQNSQQNDQMQQFMMGVLYMGLNVGLSAAMNHNNSTGYNPNAGMSNNRVRTNNNSRNNSYQMPKRSCDPRAVDVTTPNPVAGCY